MSVEYRRAFGTDVDWSMNMLLSYAHARLGAPQSARG
jgi:hypothetical protein